jgi:hypothetical protein
MRVQNLIDRRTEPLCSIKVNDFACNLVRPPGHHPRRKVIADDFRNPWIRICTVGAEHRFHLNYIGRSDDQSFFLSIF